MDQLTKLLEQLASKLGVAVDVLWTALLKQAFVSSVRDLLWIAILSYGLVWVVRYVKFVYKKVEERDWNEVAWLPCGVVVLVAFILTYCTIYDLPMTFAGFFNPEYWALMQILHK